MSPPQPATPQAIPTPGLDCPQCRQRIQVSIKALLGSASIQCQGCGLELFIDREASDKAIQALRVYHEALKKAELMKK
jgi:transcription elongation factor Elf1